MTRDHVFSILLLVLVALVIGVGVTSMVDGKRIGAAEARISIFKAQRDSAAARVRILSDSVARAQAAAAESHAVATQAESNLKTRIDRDRRKPPIAITDTAAVRAELAAKDSIIADAGETIAKKNSEISNLMKWHVWRDSVDVEREKRYLALERINGEMKKLVPSRTSKIVTAGKWLANGIAIGVPVGIVIGKALQ